VTQHIDAPIASRRQDTVPSLGLNELEELLSEVKVRIADRAVDSYSIYMWQLLALLMNHSESRRDAGALRWRSTRRYPLLQKELWHLLGSVDHSTGDVRAVTLIILLGPACAAAHGMLLEQRWWI
jgi:hypothetical protein